jgi:transmembrane sensor
MKQESATGQGPEKSDLVDLAADWHGRLDEGQPSPVARAEFDAWIEADPKHRAAFEAVDRTWSRMSDARLDPRVMEIRRKALSAAARRSMSPVRFAAVVASLAVIAGVAWLAAPRLSEFNETGASATQRVEGGSLRTAVGERSSMTLSDGSIVALNTNSQVEIGFTSGERRVRLLSGQAWFEVAKNPSRPFVVEAGHQRVTALGTAFDVRVDEHRDTVQVTLAEGKVSVEPMDSPLVAFLKPKAKPTELAPGESLITSEDGSAKKRKTDVAKISSWRLGQLVFDNDSLGAAVAEVNRYSPIQIELADPRLASYRVSGVFKAGHSDSFIETVAEHYAIRVVERSERRIVLAARQKH